MNILTSLAKMLPVAGLLSLLATGCGSQMSDTADQISQAGTTATAPMCEPPKACMPIGDLCGSDADCCAVDCDGNVALTTGAIKCDKSGSTPHGYCTPATSDIKRTDCAADGKICTKGVGCTPPPPAICKCVADFNQGGKSPDGKGCTSDSDCCPALNCHGDIAVVPVTPPICDLSGATYLGGYCVSKKTKEVDCAAMGQKCYDKVGCM